MALEKAKQKDIIRFKLDKVEMKLSQMRDSKTQVIEGSYFIYAVEMKLALHGTDCYHLLQFHHRILTPAVFRI
jgi:hypothetical protein